MDINELLAQRSPTHGDFVKQASLSGNLKAAIRCRERSIPTYQMEALEMICVKMSRIVHGDNNLEEHWADIAGYATLIVNNLEEADRIAT